VLTSDLVRVILNVRMATD